MTDRNSSKYVHSCGLSAYLLSTDDSDGASRILNSSSCCIMSNRDSYSNSTTQHSQNHSYLNLSSSCTGTGKTSFSIVPSRFEYVTSCMNNSIDKEAAIHKREIIGKVYQAVIMLTRSMKVKICSMTNLLLITIP